MNKFFFFLFLLCTDCAYAQYPTPLLLNKASFHTGDDASWSSASLNDKDWTVINAGSNWEDQGFDKYDGYAWYRFHVVLPAALKENAWWKDSVRLFLSKIDDADEVYLNGKLIAKHGSFPSDPGGYDTRWNLVREIHLNSNDPFIHWNEENILAIKVYDGGGPGGIFGTIPSISMMDMADAIKLQITTGKTSQLMVSSLINRNVEGVVSIRVTNEAGRNIQSTSLPVKLLSHGTLYFPLSIIPTERLEVKASFTEKTMGKKIAITHTPPYILTPRPSLLPRINNATVFGVRPGSPFLFRIAATGEKPLQYSADNLPAGLHLDPASGIISGMIEKKADYKIQLLVKNKRGVAKKELLVKCGDLLALTPPMGWNSWNCWGLSVSDEKLRSSAQALIDKGLADHGWTYMNIDDGWEATKRNDKGEIVPNTKFPDMHALGNWLHDHGLKFGIYSSPGPMTCGGYLGSYEHELQDAVSYNNWGIDYLKYDWCSYGRIHNEKDSTVASYKKPYEVMRDALHSQPRDICYSLCQYGMKNVWEWGDEVNGNCWRTTGDIEDNWESLYEIGFAQYKISPYAKPGRWNDPDMLIVGRVGWGENLHPTRLTADEQYTHISLWCLLSAPLLIGCDISKMDAFTLNLLSNDEVIGLDQDALGKQAIRAIDKEQHQVWIKELSDGSRAIGLFNLSEESQTIKINFTDLNLDGVFKIRDLWRQKNMGAGSSVTVIVPPHGVKLLKLYK